MFLYIYFIFISLSSDKTTVFPSYPALSRSFPYTPPCDMECAPPQPALAFAAPSQKLQAIYDSVDTLNVEELVALQDYVNAKIDASSAVNTDETTYVLNKNTKKFHYADCASAKSIKDKNRTTYTGSRDEVIANGYQPCKKCNP
ncbi:MAG: Ada metal-binding domain-containing protein [Christensenellales bacterium]